MEVAVLAFADEYLCSRERRAEDQAHTSGHSGRKERRFEPGSGWHSAPSQDST